MIMAHNIHLNILLPQKSLLHYKMALQDMP
jgi:hypothetical protein